MLKALIFDFDGLILDTESSLFEAWREIFDEYALEIHMEDWVKMLGQSADPPEAYTYLEVKIGRAVDRAALKERRIKRELSILQDQPALLGVRDLIYEVKESGLLLAVASSSEHAWVDTHLDRLDLMECFDVVICADDVPATKPAPDLYIQALNQLGVSSEDAIALEDSEHGVHAARAAGLFCIAVPNEITKGASFDQDQVTLDSLDGIRMNDILRMVAGV